MSNKTRIPRSISGMNIYLPTIDTYLKAGEPTNASRLGITDTEVAAIDAFLADWVSLYPSYADKRNKRTSAIRDNMVDLIKQIVAYDQEVHLLDRIASSPNAVVNDYAVFNIKKGPLAKNSKTIPQTKIIDGVIVTIQPVGGGMFNFKCYGVSSLRAGIQKPANSIQYRFVVGNTEPESADADILTSGLSTRGIFTLNTGAGNKGKNLYIYFRWYNTKHPEISGPWSSLQTSLIL